MFCLAVSRGLDAQFYGLLFFFFFFLMIRRPPRSTHCISSAASDVYKRQIKNNEITICAGSPGSGKTFVAVSQALTMLRKATSPYKKIYLVKSVTPLKNEELGYLKGGLMDKIEPFMWSFYLNIEKIVSEESLKSLLEKNIIRPFPIAYMRGVTIDDSIVIIDEVQNITIDNIKTIMTRIGSNCKYVLLGDRNQIDLKTKSDSSLNYLIKMFEDVEKIGVIEMSGDDENIRNPIIKIIEEKFNIHEKEMNELRASHLKQKKENGKQNIGIIYRSRKSQKCRH
eukprot:TRINITY_DN10024_c0_g1_i3.p1 TRINITY_DN10024_c0_g1~~TRINITY_DN10024_c0_g1_i3.p1  ORF type:complete len:282 (-),score=70.43 TRINITY_DN10024_c0_g1_i3:718-1563(-)